MNEKKDKPKTLPPKKGKDDKPVYGKWGPHPGEHPVHGQGPGPDPFRPAQGNRMIPNPGEPLAGARAPKTGTGAALTGDKKAKQQAFLARNKDAQIGHKNEPKQTWSHISDNPGRGPLRGRLYGTGTPGNPPRRPQPGKGVAGPADTRVDSVRSREVMDQMRKEKEAKKETSKQKSRKITQGSDEWFLGHGAMKGKKMKNEQANLNYYINLTSVLAEQHPDKPGRTHDEGDSGKDPFVPDWKKTTDHWAGGKDKPKPRPKPRPKPLPGKPRPKPPRKLIPGKHGPKPGFKKPFGGLPKKMGKGAAKAAAKAAKGVAKASKGDKI